ncbi:MAG: hypothetical protein J6B64_06740 [Bacilli bacterium]|nr:hypothetical protein [Bacilli bacterium]
MKRRIYTDEEIKVLKSNIFITDINYKRELVYDPIFKLWTIFMRLECPELTAKEIFERAGINTTILHPDLPRKRIKFWIYNYKKFGVKYFIPVDEPYTLNDKFKKQILDIVLRRLEQDERSSCEC